MNIVSADVSVCKSKDDSLFVLLSFIYELLSFNHLCPFLVGLILVFSYLFMWLSFCILCLCVFFHSLCILVCCGC